MSQLRQTPAHQFTQQTYNSLQRPGGSVMKCLRAQVQIQVKDKGRTFRYMTTAELITSLYTGFERSLG